MAELAQFNLAALRRNGSVRKSDYDLSVLRETLYSVLVERIPLIEYFVLFDHPIKSEQIKVKVYKTRDGKWYDRKLSEDAELNSPEFGAPTLNEEVKEAIDKFESVHQRV